MKRTHGKLAHYPPRSADPGARSNRPRTTQRIRGLLRAAALIEAWVPAPVETDHVVPATTDQLGFLIPTWRHSPTTAIVISLPSLAVGRRTWAGEQGGRLHPHQ